jgi:hypothetical protein
VGPAGFETLSLSGFPENPVKILDLFDSTKDWANKNFAFNAALRDGRLCNIISTECPLCGIPHDGECRNPLYPLRRGVGF